MTDVADCLDKITTTVRPVLLPKDIEVAVGGRVHCVGGADVSLKRAIDYSYKCYGFPNAAFSIWQQARRDVSDFLLREQNRTTRSNQRSTLLLLTFIFIIIEKGESFWINF